MRRFWNPTGAHAEGNTGMTTSLANGLVLLSLVAAVLPEGMLLGSSGATLVMEQDIPSRTCRHSRAYGMIQVRCANLGLEAIPSSLKTDIQILDASVNRIRVLRNDSLAQYTSLAYVYLGDNFIQEIEEGAFGRLQYLKVLDLSTNGCDSLPAQLFRLPQLQKLYLCHNKLTDDLFRRLEVTAPLAFLQLSRNRLCRIPQMGPVPTLVHLNVSGNEIASVSAEDLAPFCSLKVLDLTGNPVRFRDGDCECQTLNAWIRARGIRVRPAFNCTESPRRNCTQSAFTNRTTELYESCANILRLQVETEKARTTWMLVAGCIAAFLLCLFVGLFCVHRRNKQRRRKLKEEQRLNANNANTELLNSNLNQPENT